ncbi:FHA domain-containing protein [Thiohalophilus sp.]|uniref:FHA domain-containing protein n=1 Tax=Thiohalophilus sp. TaxID=3028392 RepID=UPI002ACD36E3|nr:FHA domain-containing protein [Thiohalophilus sp.]MDZ7663463.1 FHA domain-containing protein [Thiohalophilus sp.]
MPAKLLLKHEGLTLSSYEFDKKVLNIGRQGDNEIQLDDPAVSGRHARLVLKPNDYLENYYDVYLEDLGSTNGTIVNDSKIIRQLLKHGDVIRIGGHEFTFDSGADEHYEQTAIYLPDS